MTQKTFNPWSLVPKEHQNKMAYILEEEPEHFQASLIRGVIEQNPVFKSKLDQVPLDPGYFAYALIHTYNETKK